MTNSNRFLELSLKQQLALSEIGRDLIEIDTKIGESFFKDQNNDLSTNSNKLPTIVRRIFDLFKRSQKIE